ncbi:hypothetical protein TSAR_014907 [Trichomalopsis sarcophagae]|uniref:Uncharacterized protein n=1 Tax=Trichomalopsis sarcophagae TaxID=543379 RepID=A0A232F3I9_9HYME|nr:hypothetical protein TSAR_014907 [Trichomalopsis sarcophagae]
MISNTNHINHACRSDNSVHKTTTQGHVYNRRWVSDKRKHSSLKPETVMEYTDFMHIMGISSQYIVTLGSIKLSIMGKEHFFHILPDETPLSEHLILGNPFTYHEKVNIMFEDEVLMTESQSILSSIIVPFVHKVFLMNEIDPDEIGLKLLRHTI